MKSKTRELKAEAPEDKAVSAAVDRIYEKYGANLGAFFRDVHEELEMKRQEAVSKPLAVR